MKKQTLFFFLILFFCFFCSHAFAAAPVLFFTDIDSGPKTGWNQSSTKGAAVSIWGLNFGSTRGNSYVRCGDVNLTSDSSYAEWGASARARGMKRITFWLNSSMKDGAISISVTTDEGTSNTLPFNIRNGNIYFVDDCPSCSDNNSGTRDVYQSGTTGPWRTPGKAKSMSAGDITYIRAGAYNTEDAAGAMVYFGNGDNGGVSGRPKAWVGYPGENVALGTDDTLEGFIYKNYSLAYGSYITVAKFDFNINFNIFSCPFSGHPPGSRDNLRLVALKADHQRLTSRAASGNIFIAGGSHRKIYGCYFENLDADSWDHNIYLNTLHKDNSPQYNITDIEVAYNEFAGGTKPGFNDGSGLKLHGRDDNPSSLMDEIYVHSNYFHDLNREPIDVGAYQRNIYIYSNIFKDNGKHYYSQTFQYTYHPSSAGTVYFFNNSVIATQSLMPAIFFRDSDNSTIIFKNNLFYDQASNDLYTDANYSGQRSGAKNLFVNYPSSSSWLSNTLTSIASNLNLDVNFTPAEGSPCIGNGEDVFSIVKKDYNGVSRYGRNDIGALQYTGETAAATPIFAPSNMIFCSISYPGLDPGDESASSNNDLITFKGSASTLFAISAVNWVNNTNGQQGNGTFSSSTGIWSILNIPLTAGSNMISVSILYENGKAITCSRNVIYSP